MCNAFSHGLGGHAMSTPYVHRPMLKHGDNTTGMSTLQISNDTTGTSGIASSISTINSHNSTRINQ